MSFDTNSKTAKVDSRVQHRPRWMADIGAQTQRHGCCWSARSIEQIASWTSSPYRLLSPSLPI